MRKEVPAHAVSPLCCVAVGDCREFPRLLQLCAVRIVMQVAIRWVPQRVGRDFNLTSPTTG
jgi:hypothetical protein